MASTLLLCPLTRKRAVRFLSFWLAAAGLTSVSARAEHHNINTASGSDGIIQDVRWPYGSASTNQIRPRLFYNSLGLYRVGLVR
jgi:hypothetical protein